MLGQKTIRHVLLCLIPLHFRRRQRGRNFGHSFRPEEELNPRRMTRAAGRLPVIFQLGQVGSLHITLSHIHLGVFILYTALVE